MPAFLFEKARHDALQFHGFCEPPNLKLQVFTDQTAMYGQEEVIFVGNHEGRGTSSYYFLRILYCPDSRNELSKIRLEICSLFLADFTFENANLNAFCQGIHNASRIIEK